MEDGLKINRREFLRITAGAGAALTCPSIITGCIFDKLPDVLAGYKPRVSSIWVPRDDQESCRAMFETMVMSATDIGTWLSPGDRVFLKLALNSPYPFPATTDPCVLDCMIKLLRDNGAGEILAGDQSGIGHVNHTRITNKGSSRECCAASGLLDVITSNDATPIFFEEAGYDNGYRPVHPSPPHHWGPAPLYMTKAMDDVDHIIYLPRVANHAIAGKTFGLKLPIGFLRDDTRIYTLHLDLLNFYAKYVELNFIPEIASKLRLTVSSGRSVLTTNGPDQGEIVTPDIGLIFASEDLLANDLLASAWLEANRTGGDEKIYYHPAVMRYMEIKGGRPEELLWTQLNEHPDTAVPGYMEGLLTV
jgi:uncharacterized protein (DUF362 family)